VPHAGDINRLMMVTHYQPINIPTAGAQFFLINKKRKATLTSPSIEQLFVLNL
jgi:hypothetical protein